MDPRCLGIWKALADDTRQEILALLNAHSRNVNEICREFEKVTQPTISHHLHILKQCELVRSERKGKMIYYSLNKKMLRNGVEILIERFDIQVL
jgi:DNA-binding transcriptional ArsR family regulator